MPSIRFNPRDRIIITETRLSGNIVGTAQMVFDTGASLVVVPWKIATGLGFAIDPKKTIEMTSASTVESAPLVRIPKVSVLGEEVENVEALVKDLPPEAGVDGLLGMSFIRHFNVKIDFKIGKLTLERLKAKRPR